MVEAEMIDDWRGLADRPRKREEEPLEEGGGTAGRWRAVCFVG